VIDFMVARNGDFVLYRPPFKATTLLLWIGPFLLLALGVFALVRRLVRRRVPAPQLSDAERARAARLLE
jgi:cytochrome c-type biogenesis protein CcmH